MVTCIVCGSADMSPNGYTVALLDGDVDDTARLRVITVFKWPGCNGA